MTYITQLFAFVHIQGKWICAMQLPCVTSIKEVHFKPMPFVSTKALDMLPPILYCIVQLES